MNTNELLHVIQTLKETGFSHIDLTHEGSHILLSNTGVATNALDSNYYGNQTGVPFHHSAPSFPHLHGHQSMSSNQNLAVTSQSITSNSTSAIHNPTTVASNVEDNHVKVENHVSHENSQISPTKELVGHVIESPIVGTYYSSSNPDAEAFVSIGSIVKKGQVLCIIEAMKLMNEIESDIDGTIIEILVKNEQGVEYGQPLFRIA